MKITVSKNDIDIRLDKFLIHQQKIEEFSSNLSRGDFIRAIKNALILVNNNPVKPSYILKENDIINITDELFDDTQEKLLEPNLEMKLNIIHKNENIIVINKPAGLTVHPNFSEKNKTLANALVNRFPEIITIGENQQRPGIVHRLDKDTSGIIIIARNQKSFIELKNLFKNRQIQKKYLAIIHGVPTEEIGVISKPLARSADYKKQIIANKKTKTKVREALTRYKVIKRFINYSLLEVLPKTGRTHQIRVHLLSVGCPIVGDKLYRIKQSKLFNSSSNLTVNRHLLHASEIKFKLFNEKYHFTAPLPNDFKSFLNSL